MTELGRQQPGPAAVEEHARLRVRSGDQGGEHGDDSSEPGHDGRCAEIVVRHGYRAGFRSAGFRVGRRLRHDTAESALSYMSAGWLGAIVTYGVGWYLGRKKARQEHDVMVPGGQPGEG